MSMSVNCISSVLVSTTQMVSEDWFCVRITIRQKLIPYKGVRQGSIEITTLQVRYTALHVQQQDLSEGQEIVNLKRNKYHI